MYGEGKRLDIQLLLSAGSPREQIARLTGVSVRTIRRIGREPAQPWLAVAEPAATEPAGLLLGRAHSSESGSSMIGSPPEHQKFSLRHIDS